MTRPRVGHAMSRVIETPRSVAKTVVYYGETTNKPSSPRVDRPAGDATTTDRRSRHGRMRAKQDSTDPDPPSSTRICPNDANSIIYHHHRRHHRRHRRRTEGAASTIVTAKPRQNADEQLQREPARGARFPANWHRVESDTQKSDADPQK